MDMINICSRNLASSAHHYNYRATIILFDFCNKLGIQCYKQYIVPASLQCVYMSHTQHIY